jgi:hypothetical protein
MALVAPRPPVDNLGQDRGAHDAASLGVLDLPFASFQKGKRERPSS